MSEGHGHWIKINTHTDLYYVPELLIQCYIVIVPKGRGANLVPRVSPRPVPWSVMETGNEVEELLF